MTDPLDETPGPRGERRSAPALGYRPTRPGAIVELVAGSPVGEYEIVGQIGEGGMGTVYAAAHPVIGKRVAIKVLRPELCANPTLLARFIAEAQAVNQIGHPNIVDVFSLGELPDGRAYLVMEWLRGEELTARIARGPLPAAEVCAILEPIARALRAAHAQQIVHRDLKPDNVFLTQIDGAPMMVKLLDFGIAKLARPGAGAEKTQTGDLLGTPRYVSPEQARGVGVDHRSDLYSLGVVAYEMLAGHTPFDGVSAMDLVVAHMQTPPPPLDRALAVPRPLADLVMRLLAKDPAERPTLEEVLAVASAPAALVAAPVHAPRSHRTIWIAAAVVVAASAVAIVVVPRLRETPPGPPPPPIVMPVQPAPVAAPTPPPTPEIAAPVAPPAPVVAPPATEPSKPPPPSKPAVASRPGAHAPAHKPPPTAAPVPPAGDDDVLDPRVGRKP